MILLVEDNEDLLELISDSLALSNIPHICASSLNEAIKTFQENKNVSMIITDLQLRANTAYPLLDLAHERGVAVTIVSGSVEGIRKDYEDKVQNIFFKPFDLEPFINYIETFLVKKC